MMATSPASPTKSSLTSWWKSFKQKPNGQESGAADSSSSLVVPQRPYLPHQSRSSGAITTSSTGKTLASKSENPMNMIPSDLRDSPIFGVELHRSIQYANVSISLSDPSGEQFVYGYIPIVVAKCGVYLKKNATCVEGIFRLSGSARRIKELELLFNSPPRFGKGLDWSGFNVHDAANVLRRYLNNLPEPIIPLQYYEQFRDPLRERPRIVEYLSMHSAIVQNNNSASTASSPAGGQSQQQGPKSSTAADNALGAHYPVLSSKSSSSADADSALPMIITTSEEPAATTTTSTSSSTDSAINSDSPIVDKQLLDDISSAVDRYQQLILTLPLLNRQLLMYILDLLSIFAAKKNENLMPAANLAAIFQPSLLSHPQHDMAPNEYHLSRVAIEFLIQHSNKFLSYIESISIKQHEELKAQRNGGGGGGTGTSAGTKTSSKTSSSNATLSNSSPYINGSASEAAVATNKHVSDGKHLIAPRRKHSKSLSSVGGPAPPVASVYDNSKYHMARVPPVSTEHSDSIRVRKRPPLDNSSSALSQGSATPSQDASADEHGLQNLSTVESNSSNSGILSSIKRSVSFSRRPSQKGRATSDGSIRSSSGRATSGGSHHASSNVKPSAVESNPLYSTSTEELARARQGSRDSDHAASARHPSVTSNSSTGTEGHEEESRGYRKGLSGLFTRRSKSPLSKIMVGRRSSNTSDSQRNDSDGELQTPRYLGRDQYEGNPSLTIDQALASPNSPPLSATSTDIHSQAVRHRALHGIAVGGHSNDSATSLTKTMSEGSSVGDDSENGSSQPRPALNTGNSPTRTSRWRKSLMLFNSNDDDKSSSTADLMTPPPSLDQLSPRNSGDSSRRRGNSPARWLKRRSGVEQ